MTVTSVNACTWNLGRDALLCSEIRGSDPSLSQLFETWASCPSSTAPGADTARIGVCCGIAQR
jgi:hypothetical protein